jgi:hypothetical protein
LRKLINIKKPILFVGDGGTAKTVMINNTLENLPKPMG